MRAPKIRQVQVKTPAQAGFWVLTISDTRTHETDEGGALIREYLEANGHSVAGHAIVKDEPSAIAEFIQRQREAPNGEFIILTGGTGISRRDATFETIRSLLDREITGFGELFRMLSYYDIGTPAILSRATAGLVGNKTLFSIPGSVGAIRLAMEKIILPEVGHILHELSKQPGRPNTGHL